MRWGISTLLIDKTDILSNAHLLKELGIDYLEIRAELNHFRYDDEGYVDSLRSVLKKTGLLAYSLHMPISEVDISYLDETKRIRSIREIKKACRSFMRLGGEIVVVHPGGRMRDELLRKDHLAKSFESLWELNNFFSDCGLKMALENTLPPRIGSGIEEILTLLKRLNSNNAGICLDTGHINIEGDPVLALRKFANYLIHLHIADNRGKNDDHFLPGKGSIDWESFLTILKEIDYQGIFMLEVKNEQTTSKMIQRIKKVKEKITTLW